MYPNCDIDEYVEELMRATLWIEHSVSLSTCQRSAIHDDVERVRIRNFWEPFGIEHCSCDVQGTFEK